MTVLVVPDPVATLRAVLIARAVGTDLEGVEIRSGEREEGDVPPYAIVREAGFDRVSIGALLPARVTLSITAETDGQAAALWRLASSLLHMFGPVVVVVDGEQVGVWKVKDQTGLQQPVKEPDSEWWRANGVFSVVMTDRAIG